ncbi:pickpocket protein 11-like [Periplaneta americana]|uniref:pickpocket protein 11-like n=1 Tax=Periplaneta americana TaxID=6978 RepID=UPI0037E9487F
MEFTAERSVQSVSNNKKLTALFHDPLDYPETSLQTALIEPKQMVTVLLGAEVIESVDDVRWLSVAQRSCWFDDEVTVVGSSEDYSYQTCITECRMRVLLEKCNCTPFFYPLFNTSSRVCSLVDTNCLRSYRRTTSGLQPTNKPTFGEDVEMQEMTGMNCSCLPQCTDKSYTFDRETAHLQTHLASPTSILNNPNHTNISILHVFFRDITCMKYARDAYMTWDAVFATFGGIFGLCMGGSVISIFELCYRVLLLVLAFLRTLLVQRIQPPRGGGNVRSVTPQQDDLNILRKGENIRNITLQQDDLNILRKAEHSKYFRTLH